MSARVSHPPPLVAILVRRAAAYVVDVAAIMAYALLLAAVTLLLWRPESSIGGGTLGQAVAGQVIGLLTLTLPVVLAFAWLTLALSCVVGHGRGWHDRAARVLIRRDGTEMSGGSKGHVRAETR